MDSTASIKEQIVKLLADNFGEHVAFLFFQTYDIADLPLYTQEARQILVIVLGQEYTDMVLQDIYLRHNLPFYVH